MEKLDVTVEPVDAFFDRVRDVARLTDAAGPIPERHAIAFEAVEDLVALLTRKRLELLQAVKAAPRSIADLARRLHRDRAAVTRDVQTLARFGIVEVTDTPLPGHGRQKCVRASAHKLTARM